MKDTKQVSKTGSETKAGNGGRLFGHFCAKHEHASLGKRTVVHCKVFVYYHIVYYRTTMSGVCFLARESFRVRGSMNILLNGV